MNRRRLREASKFLKETKFTEGKFDMGTWARFDNSYEKEGVELKHPTGDCGSAGCAMGWFTYRFKDLKLVKRDWPTYEPYYKKKGSSRGAYGFDAAKLFFDITFSDALFLFDPVWYNKYEEEITPIDVAKRIDFLLRNGGIEKDEEIPDYMDRHNL